FGNHTECRTFVVSILLAVYFFRNFHSTFCLEFHCFFYVFFHRVFTCCYTYTIRVSTCCKLYWISVSWRYNNCSPMHHYFVYRKKCSFLSAMSILGRGPTTYNFIYCFTSAPKSALHIDKLLHLCCHHSESCRRAEY